MSKKVIVIILLAFVLTSNASAKNPFIEIPQQNDSKINKTTLPDLKKILPIVEQPNHLQSEQSTQTHQQVQNQFKWTIEGRINEKVILKDGNKIEVIADGTVFQDCLVQYPDIICDKELIKSMQKTKKEIERLIEENKNLKKQIDRLNSDIKGVTEE